MRDPRINPQPGDEFSGHYNMTLVISNIGGVVTYKEHAHGACYSSHLNTISLARWTWCVRNTEVAHASA